MSGYTGRVDESQVSDLIVTFGQILEDADEMGFVLTYHAARGDSGGRMQLAGRGINQDLLEQCLRDALDHNAEHGNTL